MTQKNAKHLELLKIRHKNLCQLTSETHSSCHIELSVNFTEIYIVGCTACIYTYQHVNIMYLSHYFRYFTKLCYLFIQDLKCS